MLCAKSFVHSLGRIDRMRSKERGDRMFTSLNRPQIFFVPSQGARRPFHFLFDEMFFPVGFINTNIIRGFLLHPAP